MVQSLRFLCPSVVTQAVIEPLIPKPSADQALPFHFAMWFTVIKPAVVNCPPA